MVLLVHVATVLAQNPPPSTTSPADTTTAAPRQTKPVQLSDGVSEILTLVHGKVGDDIVVSFVENSRKTYTLTANEILYLREEKVSNRVLAAMINQRKKMAEELLCLGGILVHLPVGGDQLLASHALCSSVTSVAKRFVF
jgi:hypothetical protein